MFGLGKHVHFMLPVRAQDAGELPTPLGGGSHLRSTAVLRRCSCGAFDSIVIAGSWSLGDLLGTSPKDSVEAFIKGV